MINIDPTILIIMGEAILALVVVMVGVVIFMLKGRKRDREAVAELQNRLQKNASKRQEWYESVLAESIENGDSGANHELASSWVDKENEFYAQLMNMYMKRNSTALRGLDKLLHEYTSSYLELVSLMQARIDEEQSTVPDDVTLKLERMVLEGERMAGIIKTLEQENARLSSELDGANKEIDQVMDEYSKVFRHGGDSSGSGGTAQSAKAGGNVAAAAGAAAGVVEASAEAAPPVVDEPLPPEQEEMATEPEELPLTASEEMPLPESEEVAAELMQEPLSESEEVAAELTEEPLPAPEEMEAPLAEEPAVAAEAGLEGDEMSDELTALSEEIMASDEGEALPAGPETVEDMDLSAFDDVAETALEETQVETPAEAGGDESAADGWAEGFDERPEDGSSPQKEAAVEEDAALKGPVIDLADEGEVVLPELNSMLAGDEGAESDDEEIGDLLTSDGLPLLDESVAPAEGDDALDEKGLLAQLEGLEEIDMPSFSGGLLADELSDLELPPKDKEKKDEEGSEGA